MKHLVCALNLGWLVNHVIQLTCLFPWLVVILWATQAPLLLPVTTLLPPAHLQAGVRPPTSQPEPGPNISAINTNLADYPAGQVPRHTKLEITFAVSTVATNLQWPYDDSPPPGIAPAVGITVNALFTPDDWATVYTQPAFLYQDFLFQREGTRDWIYPTDHYAWKVRFSPNQAGPWQFKLTARDAAGFTESTAQPFMVTPSKNKGFVRVSATDPRYFEFENGEHFLGLGYNLTYGQLDWNNPSSNRARFRQLHANGLQLFRTWLSQWGIFTSAWGAWNSPLPERHALYIPDPSLSMNYVYPGSDVSMVLTWNTNPGMFLGFMKQTPAVKRNTTYRLFIRYLIPEPLRGPRIAGHPFGLVAKTGGWLAGSGAWPENVSGYTDPGTGVVVSSYVARSPANSQGKPQWSLLKGEITTTDADFLPLFYLVLENVAAGSAESTTSNSVYIDLVEIREDLGNGRYGPNIVSKPWMAQHLYFEQRNSYVFDKVLELAARYDIYFKLVILEKNVWDLSIFGHDGNPLNDSHCPYDDAALHSRRCPNGAWFYGNGRQMTKVRWLQQAWWRYLQARWGYSPHIHSWELLNEGDPASEAHYILADEFANYMHQFAPNDHLVTTSFWHSFPRQEFWANPAYSSIDYADLHHYDDVTDVAENTHFFSMRFGALQPEGANKPLIRGETGYPAEILADTAGIWLHNLIWAGLNAGGMYEQYWYGQQHIEQADRNNDLRHHYRAFANFMDTIPLNNGQYEDAQAIVSHESLRAWGQQDLQNGCAHLWLQNSQHTWRNVVDAVPIPPISATIRLMGFQPGHRYRLEWWDTYATHLTAQTVPAETIVARSDGTLQIHVRDLSTDVALKIVSTKGCQ